LAILHQQLTNDKIADNITIFLSPISKRSTEILLRCRSTQHPTSIAKLQYCATNHGSNDIKLAKHETVSKECYTNYYFMIIAVLLNFFKFKLKYSSLKSRFRNYHALCTKNYHLSKLHNTHNIKKQFHAQRLTKAGQGL
jgi:hypothetical protein